MLTDQYWYIISRIWKYENVERRDSYEGTTTRIQNFFTQPTEIIDNLYLGNIYNAADSTMMDSIKIDTIINVSRNISNYFPSKFKYINIQIDDLNSEMFSDEVLEVIAHMHRIMNSNKKLLVHCLMGSSRSATIVILYLIKYNKMSVDEAYKFIKSKRPTININTTFMDQLYKFESNESTSGYSELLTN